MISKKEIISEIKEKAVQIGHFTLTSGQTSNYYIDIKKLITNHRSLDLLTDEITNKIGNIDKIAGVELGAVPLVSVVSVKKKVPMIIIRKNIKEHGTKSPFEGDITKGDKIAIIEDVTTTGDSVLRCIDLLKNQGAIIESVITVVDRNQGAKEKIEKLGIKFEYLANLDDLGLN